MQTDQHPRRIGLAASSTRERAEPLHTQGVCQHCGGRHRLMEICPAAPGAIELMRQFSHGERTPIHLLAVVGIATLAVLWTVATVALFA